jgi:flavin reductase (DIM6/NTAB) family NADH-FMN oxidoreductase RutF
MDVDPRLLHRLFYPQVPLVLSAQLRGRVSAMPVVSYTSLSDSPPLVAVSCDPESFTCKLVVKAKCFSLSVLDRSRSSAVEELATKSGAKVKDKLDEAGLSHRPGTKLKVPVIDGAEATLECRLRYKRKVGDHLLVTGRVIAVYASGAFGEFWDFDQYRPLLYTGWKDGLTEYKGPQP